MLRAFNWFKLPQSATLFSMMKKTVKYIILDSCLTKSKLCSSDLIDRQNEIEQSILLKMFLALLSSCFWHSLFRALLYTLIYTNSYYWTLNCRCISFSQVDFSTSTDSSASDRQTTISITFDRWIVTFRDPVISIRTDNMWLKWHLTVLIYHSSSYTLDINNISARNMFSFFVCCFGVGWLVSFSFTLG